MTTTEQRDGFEVEKIVRHGDFQRFRIYQDKKVIVEVWRFWRTPYKKRKYAWEPWYSNFTTITYTMSLETLEVLSRAGLLALKIAKEMEGER